jgi:uncharacterized membrane protein
MAAGTSHAPDPDVRRPEVPQAGRSGVAVASGLLGFALSGFFDGILLHQVLQWHHLLSALGGAYASLRVQVLADGLFHVLMYVLAIAGLWLLFRRRAALTGGAARRVFGAALVGFGTWHVLDAFVSHWWLGIHRIRMDVPNPLFWDLLWFFVFGVAVGGAGLWLLRRRGPPSSPRRAHGAATSLVLAVVVTAPLAALPPRAGAPALVLFAPGTAPERVHDALVLAGAGLLSFDARANLWVVDLPRADASRTLRSHGALLVTRSPVVLGCVAWSRRA